ncbi:MAG: putative alpha-E superfamily protein [Akkermansiaceae bacterium]|jgi:uncharacterized alpha-E superfamily protein
MLSRVADSLYWLGRYVERAENLARMVEVTRQEDLESFNQSAIGNVWQPVIYATILDEDLSEKQQAALDDDPAYYIALSSLNPTSIAACIALARENARTVRDQLSEEMWLELNAIHLFMTSEVAQERYRSSPEGLFRQIIRFSIIFQGLSQSTIRHDEGWHFSRLGRFIERADKTSRILDTLTFNEEMPSQAALMAVLRSCSAFTAYRAQYRTNLSLKKVAAFLFFSPEFPRSIRFCLGRIDATLLAISGTRQGAFSNEAERLAGRALAMANFTQINQLIEDGLHQEIDRFQGRLNEISQSIFEEYVLLPSAIREAIRTEGLQTGPSQQQMQKQN